MKTSVQYPVQINDAEPYGLRLVQTGPNEALLTRRGRLVMELNRCKGVWRHWSRPFESLEDAFDKAVEGLDLRKSEDRRRKVRGAVVSTGRQVMTAPVADSVPLDKWAEHGRRI